MKRYLLLYILFLVKIAFGQKNYFGIGFNYGYKSIYNEGGVFLSSRLFNHLDLSLGLSKGKYVGYGISSEIKVPITKYSFQPFIGVAYTKSFGQKFDLSVGDNITYYRISQKDFFVPEIGLIKKIKIPEDEKNPNLKAIVLLSLCFSYSYTENDPKLIYEGGYLPNSNEKRINNRLKNGIGGSFSFIILFAKYKKN